MLGIPRACYNIIMTYNNAHIKAIENKCRQIYKVKF
jgi:hypothetical protein